MVATRDARQYRQTNSRRTDTGHLLSWLSPDSARAVGLLGTLFVGALKSVAPVLVLVLVMASVANHRQGQKISIRPILLLYLIGTFSAALTAVIVSFLFPSRLHLVAARPMSLRLPVLSACWKGY
jgi:serine/threonine transporter